MSKIENVKVVMSKVYGAYTSNWKPRSFDENKSRYLWTDAYGVVNFLTLYSETSDEQYLKQAKCLVGAVHDTLGKTRDGAHRLSNATDARPTLGGLRIGKPKAEGGGMSEDGQYYHYLTKWMFALSVMARATGERQYAEWAADLASAVHPRFVQPTSGGGGGERRMFWKMSIDLSRPLVNSEGGLDAYDGFVTYRLVQEALGSSAALQHEIEEMGRLVETRYARYRTNDCLDAGEALWLAHFLPQEAWAKHVRARAEEAVERLWAAGELGGAAGGRLAFREFGTTIGAQVDGALASRWAERVAKLHDFWAPRLFGRDADITPVMYCSSLLPGWLQNSYKRPE